MVHIADDELDAWQAAVLQLEREGLATRTFRRLDPDRQLAVIEAILEDAADHGPAAVGVKRVAARAGVAVGSLYQYFPRRDGMLAFAAELAARFLTTALAGYQAPLAALPLREALSAYLSGGVEWSRARQGLLRFFARAAYHGDEAFRETVVAPVAEALRALLRAVLGAAQQRGELRDGLDLDDAVRFVHVVTVAVGDAELLPHLNSYFLVFDPSRPAEPTREAFVDLVVQAIGAPQPAKPRRSNAGRRSRG
jgi:AcrR family transcriptional regulator